MEEWDFERVGIGTSVVNKDGGEGRERDCIF